MTSRASADVASKPVGVPALTLGTAALLVLWGALAGAQAELAGRAALFAIRPALHVNFHFNPLAIGIGPLVNLPIVATVASVAWLVSRSIRPARAFEFVLFVVVWLAAWEVAMLTQRVHSAALAVLAAGAASVITSLVMRFQAVGIRLIKLSTILMSAAAIGGSVLILNGPGKAERTALATAPLPPADAPNVLLLILDTVRAIELGMYGNQRNVSPGLDSLARSAIWFRYAHSTAPWTLPSHVTMLSGRYSHEMSADWIQPYDGQFPLLSEKLRDKGYATAAFAGNIRYLSRRWGLNRGFLRYEDYQVDPTILWTTSNLGNVVVDLVNTASRHRVKVNGPDASLIRKRFGAWQQSIANRPFFAVVNFFDAHAPYGAPAPYDTMFLGRRPRYYDINNWRQRDTDELNELRAGYDQAIAWLDSQVSALLTDLRNRGVLERTLVVVTADHGEDFGEHGYSGHGASVHSTQSRVPLLIIPPGWSGARVIDEHVTLRDLAATMAEFAGLASGAVPGQSLSVHWKPGNERIVQRSPILVEVTEYDDIRPWYPTFNGSLRSIIERRMRYTVQDNGREWLHDLDRDPLELNDLSVVPSYRAVMDSLRAALTRARRTETDSSGRG